MNRTLFFAKNILIIWLFIIVISSPDINSQVDRVVKLEVKRDASLCKYRGREVQITVNVGNFVKSDSLFGYELYIKYDRTKLKFDSFLFNGTMTEFFDMRHMDFLSENDTGYVDAWAGTFNRNPITGNRHLVAFGGDYIGDCPDSAFVIVDMIDFTDENEDVFSDTVNVFVTANIESDPLNYVEGYFEDQIIDTLKYDSVRTIKVYADQNIDYNLDSVRIDLLIETDNFSIQDIKIVSDKINEKSITYKDNKANIMLSVDEVLESELLFEVDVKNIYKKEFHESQFTIATEPLNSCGCIQQGSEYSITLMGEYDPPVGVYDKTSTEFSYQDDLIKVINSENIKKIEIFDITGSRKFSQNYHLQNDIHIQTENFRTGIYFITIDYKNTIENKKIYIQ